MHQSWEFSGREYMPLILQIDDINLEVAADGLVCKRGRGGTVLFLHLNR